MHLISTVFLNKIKNQRKTLKRRFCTSKIVWLLVASCIKVSVIILKVNPNQIQIFNILFLRSNFDWTIRIRTNLVAKFICFFLGFFYVTFKICNFNMYVHILSGCFLLSFLMAVQFMKLIIKNNFEFSWVEWNRHSTRPRNSVWVTEWIVSEAKRRSTPLV